MGNSYSESGHVSFPVFHPNEKLLIAKPIVLFSPRFVKFVAVNASLLWLTYLALLYLASCVVRRLVAVFPSFTWCACSLACSLALYVRKQSSVSLSLLFVFPPARFLNRFFFLPRFFPSNLRIPGHEYFNSRFNSSSFTLYSNTAQNFFDTI